MIHRLKAFLTPETLREIFRFFIAGASGLVVQFGLYWLLMRVWTFENGYLLASMAAFVVAVAVNYVICATWVFNVKSQTLGKMALFLLTSVIGLGINTAMLWVLVDKLRADKMLGQLLAAGVVMFWNYATKRLVLKER